MQSDLGINTSKYIITLRHLITTKYMLDVLVYLDEIKIEVSSIYY